MKPIFLTDFLIPGPLSPTTSTLCLSLVPLFIHFLLFHLTLRENTWLIRLAIAPVQIWVTWRLLGGIAFSNQSSFGINYVLGVTWTNMLITLPRGLLPHPYRFKHPYTGSFFRSGLFISNPFGDYFHPNPPYFIPSKPYPPSPPSSLPTRIPPLVQYGLHQIPPIALFMIAAIFAPNLFKDDFSVLDSGWLGLGVTLSTGIIAWSLLTATWCLNNWFQQSLGDKNTEPRGNLMNRPWRSTSVHEFWSCRWHALFLPIILFYKALLLPSGNHQSEWRRQWTKFGTPFLGFLITSLYHEDLIYPMANTNRPRLGYMSLFFLLQPFALLIERAFFHLSGGRKVGGPLGWVWTIVWLGFTGRYLAEGYILAGSLRRLNPIVENFRAFMGLLG